MARDYRIRFTKAELLLLAELMDAAYPKVDGISRKRLSNMLSKIEAAFKSEL